MTVYLVGTFDTLYMSEQNAKLLHDKDMEYLSHPSGAFQSKEGGGDHNAINDLPIAEMLPVGCVSSPTIGFT